MVSQSINSDRIHLDKNNEDTEMLAWKNRKSEAEMTHSEPPPGCCSSVHLGSWSGSGSARPPPPVRAPCPRLCVLWALASAPQALTSLFPVPSPRLGLSLCSTPLPGGVPGLLVPQQRSEPESLSHPRRFPNCFEKDSGFAARSQVLPPQTQNEPKAIPLPRSLPLNSRPVGV